MKKKTLIIEDQATMRRNVALMLQLEGYETSTAANGREGVEVAYKEQPDLILCDVMMPELDGYGVVKALREDANFATTPFIFLTAKRDRNDVRVGMNFGADDYLTKPVVREDLLAAVQTRLARAGAVARVIEEAGTFAPDFENFEPLQHAIGLTALRNAAACRKAPRAANANSHFEPLHFCVRNQQARLSGADQPSRRRPNLSGIRRDARAPLVLVYKPRRCDDALKGHPSPSFM